MFGFGAAMVPSLLSFLQKLCEAGYRINATSLFNVANDKNCCRVKTVTVVSCRNVEWMNELREKDSLLFRKAGIKCHTLSHETHLRMPLAVESVKAVKAIAWHCACSVHCLKTSQKILNYIQQTSADIFQIDPDQVRAAGASRRKEPHLASATVVEIVDSSS